MNWFIAKIIFRISNESETRSQFDEHLRLISAEDFEEAFLKARILGISEEDTFLNDYQKAGKWEFINVAELYPISELRDGSEIYSHVHETEEATNYIHHVHQRAIFMQTKDFRH